MNLGSGFKYIIVFLVIIVTSGMLFTNGIFNNGANSIPQNAGQAVNIQDVQPEPAKDTLQLKGLKGTLIPTPTAMPSLPPPATPPPSLPPQEYTPPPLPSSNPSSAPPPAPQPSAWSCTTPFEIRNCSCMTVYTDGHRITCPSGQPSNMARITDCTDILNQQDPTCVMTPDRQQRGCTSECYAKPVIYLYPLTPTNVSVKVETSGKIIVSNPLYPKNGWENVLAFPNGTLVYQGKVYNELFYETDVTKSDGPKTGTVVDIKDIKNTLYTLTHSLGLIKPEQDELVNYWLPRLKDLDKKYIFVSLVDRKTKEKNDKVIISPNPDTRIEFILYFKGLDKKINVEPLVLPKNPPKRVGFTEVEWGGTIATE